MNRFLTPLFLFASASHAEPISLSQPIDCTLGETCYIQQVVDQDPGPGVKDFQCGALSYDGHQGTDFALPFHSSLSEDFAVLAASAGEVRATRNDMPDILFDAPSAPDIAGRECGNGVVLRHENGWETQYCHLAQGSIAVSVGDQVAAGDTLGFVGLSGHTEFPHLHLSLRHNGQVIDPFDTTSNEGCAEPKIQLWDPPISVPSGGIISAGFSFEIPAYDTIKAGTAAHTRIAPTAPALVVWMFNFGTRAGDVFSLRIDGPQGEVFGMSEALTKPRAQMFRAGGRRAPPQGWPTGRYVGTARLERDGVLLDQELTEVLITNEAN
jgi:hypothetical protein